MSYYITYQLEAPCFQLIKVPSTLWAARNSILDAISEFANPGATTIKSFETVDERINFLTSSTRTFSYYGPFDSVDELTSYFTNNYPELLI